MPKRQPKPEPITPEEVMDSPALQGFDSFLRYRSAEEEGPAKRGATKPAERRADGVDQSPTSKPPAGLAPMGERPIPDSPLSDQTGATTPAAKIPLEIAEFKPGPKIRRVLRAQDGHSLGEQAVYQALWSAASAETSETRLIRIGYGGLQSLCGLDKTNCKDNIQSLIRKLAVEVAEPFNVEKSQGNAYRVFSPSAILKRRKAAGMEWVIRNKGVRFVSHPPMGE